MSRLPETETRRRRILFRATHRGTYENDLLIGSFVRSRLDRFTDTELDEIERVMDFPEPVLADWLMGRAPIPPEADCLILRQMLHAAHSGEARPVSVSLRERAGVRVEQAAAPSPNPLPEGEGFESLPS